MNDCIKSNLPGFLYTFIMFWNPFLTPALFLGVMGYARFLFLSFVLSQWLMIQGTRESKISASLSFCRGSRVEGSRSRARVPCRGSRATFFFPKFFFLEKVIIDALKKIRRI